MCVNIFILKTSQTDNNYNNYKREKEDEIKRKLVRIFSISDKYYSVFMSMPR